MSVLASVYKSSPYGKEEECSRFDISDAREKFTIFGVMSPGSNYILSFWVCSDSAGTIVIGEQTLATSSQWEQHIISITAAGADLTFDFEAAGTYYIYHPKLELGKIGTDWTPAPEDHEQLVAESTSQTNRFVKEQTDAVRDSCETMVNDATDKMVPKDEFNLFEQVVEARFAVQSDEISMQFGTAKDLANAVDADLNTKFSELYKYITFDEKGITIGSADSSITLELDNRGIVFKKNGVQFGFWDGTDFYTGNIVVEVQKRAQLGNFAFLPRGDGSLSFLKVGG